MTIQSILEAALLHARSRFPLKSHNKSYPDKEQLVGIRRQLHSTVLDDARRDEMEKRDEDLSAKDAWDTPDLYRWLRTAQTDTGNCLDHSLYVFYYLVENYQKVADCFGHPVNIQIIELTKPGDHLFVVVNQNPSGPDGSHFPAHMASCNRDAWVCDAWANIICPAWFYPQRWSEKMEKWSRNGKRLELGDDDFVDPADVRDCIRTCGKIVNYQLQDLNRAVIYNPPLHQILSPVFRRGLWP